MRSIPLSESLEIEFKSDVSKYRDHDLIEDIVVLYVGTDKEAIAAATNEVLKKIIDNSKLAKLVSDNSPEYNYTLGIVKDKIKENEEG